MQIKLFDTVVSVAFVEACLTAKRSMKVLPQRDVASESISCPRSLK